MREHDDRTALVTGASSGIGRRTAAALARAGADVAVAAPKSERERLERLAADIEADHDSEALVVPTDVSEVAQVRRTVERTVETFGGLDVVVNNAGVGNPGPFDEVPIDEYRRLMGVNVDGMYFTARESIPHLRRSGGNLVFVGSIAGQYPSPGSAVYAASKWWVRGFAHSIAGTVGDDGVAVTVVNPSEVRTGIVVDGLPPSKERHAPGTVTEPETVAAAVVYAAAQSPPDSVSQLDLYRRDKLSEFR
jgi:NAD(P)-dependent dehydrogenase (short-subunit alcohol dehydrogenase family)